ncbi:hypothetical protein K439DRAFT_1625944 [Ramaria rubella]|nr:hypothetical protein K439DRAFT_1625944 [Ramaria rubella]
MARPPSSPFQPQLGDELTPQELLDHLNSILVDVLPPGSFIKGDGRPEMVTLLRDLCGIMMGEFPQADVTEWNMLKDRVKIIEISLKLIDRALLCVEGIVGGSEELERVMLAQFLILGGTLETWIITCKHPEEDVPTPQQLKTQLRLVSLHMLTVLAGIGHGAHSERKPPLRREALRTCLDEYLGIVSDLSSISFTGPLRLTFFGAPRLSIDTVENAGTKHSTVIHSTVIFDSLIMDSLHLVTHSVCSLTMEAIVPDVLKRATEIACSYFADLLENTARVSLSRLTVTIAHSLRAIAPLLSLNALDTLLVPPYMCRLLVKRLRDGPLPAWDEVDEILSKTLEAIPLGTKLGVEALWFQQILETRNWEDEREGKLRDMIYTCIQVSVPLISFNRLQKLETTLLTQTSCQRRDDLLQDIHQQMHPVKALATSSLGKRKRDVEFSRTDIRNTVTNWFFSDDSGWATSFDDLSDAEWCNAVIEAISRRLVGSFVYSAGESRVLVAKRLGGLPCLMSHAGSLSCSRSILTLGLSFIPAFMNVASHLLEGSDDASRSKVQLHVYESLRQAARHHSQGFGGNRLESIATLIMHGMQRKERGVRLSAGRVLAELIPVCQSSTRGSLHRVESLFRVLTELLYGANLGVTETSLITAGIAGRVAQGDVLGKILQLIVAQFGHHNPVIKGLAYMQLLDLTAHHAKSPYALLAPYLPSISVSVVSALSTNPELFLQTCNFLEMSASKFYNLTIGHFLPHLVCTCNGDVLSKVARELRKSPVSLVTTHDVLACVFLLDRPGQTERVFNFILELLVQSKNDTSGDVTVLMLVKSTVVPLLGEIVICLGDEDQRRTASAVSAIQKVEAILAPDRCHRSTALLNDYVMGIVSHLNEVLQDVHGKKPLAVKKKVMRSLGALIQQVGSQITTVAPQIMATMQSMLVMHALADETLSSWHTFITTLAFKDIGPYVGPTSAAFVTAWPNLKPPGRQLVIQAFKYLIHDNAEALGENLDEIVRLNGIPELAACSARLDTLRALWTPTRQLENLLDRVTSDNPAVAELSHLELKDFMSNNQQRILKLASGDVFDPIISRLVASLWDTACRDGEGVESLRLLAFDCIGRLGAVDPDRLELAPNDSSIILYQNFGEEEESIQFVLYLITQVLLGTFRSTSDIKFQSHLAFAIQELLKFCGFSEQLVSADSANAIPLKTRSRWSQLPRHVLEACTPLLQAKYTRTSKPPRQVVHPIYPSQPTYREWMQDWTAHLIERVSGKRAKAIFDVFRPVVVDRDVGVARHLLPHLVLHVIISGNDTDTQNLQSEIAAVLMDQVQPAVSFSSNRRLLCAQTVFMLMDHLNKWIRAVRQDLAHRRTDTRRSRVSEFLHESENNLAKVDSVLSSVDHELMAKAAFECKAYARSLMNFERQILVREERGIPRDDSELQSYYERLHEIYAHLDEPDGMEGVTAKVLAPSLEHQIRQHESTGRWTSAQSCWEVRLQKYPDNLEFHLGLLRCLRNLGHYDTLRTHIKGVLSRNPDWHDALSGFQAEGAWMVGDWHCVQELTLSTLSNPLPEITVARVLLAMREGDPEMVTRALSVARAQLGAPIHAAGKNSYRRAYQSVLNLHLVHDLELIYEATAIRFSKGKVNDVNAIGVLSETLSRRFEATLPSFRTREPILSLQRTALGLSGNKTKGLKTVIGRAWLSTAKIARKAGHSQTAYSAMLQAERAETPFSFIQSAKLVKAGGEPIRALQELNKALEKSSMKGNDDVIDLTEEVDLEITRLNAKAHVLRAQWMYDAERFDADIIHKGFKEGVSLAQSWESAHFHLGKFYDQQFNRMAVLTKDSGSAQRLNLETIKSYVNTLQTGSKYVYQTLPRMLTLWLDLGEKASVLEETRERELDRQQVLNKVNNKIKVAMGSIATYKWLTAFPQIVSRIEHSNKLVYELLSDLIILVLQEYPYQGLWLFMSVVQSKKPERSRRGDLLLNKLTNDSHHSKKSVSMLANHCRTMTSELLKLCNHVVPDDLRAPLSMTKLFPGLARLTPSRLIIPLQESLIASLPSESSLEASHKPFPHHLPTIEKFDDAVEVMKSLAKPRKITLHADNGKTFAFLGKPKDDLRKDARLMDFNAIINKLLKTNSDSRRRQLHIRTYSVVTLNEESGLIEWVPNTVPMRPVLARGYEVRNISLWSAPLNQIFAKLKDLEPNQAAEIFGREVLPMYPPVFHEWFIDTFPEPSAWLASRLAYARTAAVMSMVGFIIGLGDRHSENILLDVNTGDVIHVDFDCLFEKGRRLDTPERVPFRLTQNMQDGLGVTNVDGPFRIACEITMGLLRRNKDCLMSVLDAFVHDPLVEWEDEKKRMEKQRKTSVRGKKGHTGYVNTLKGEVDLRKLAQEALFPIEKRLQGVYTLGAGAEDWKGGKEMSTSNLVETLIQEAKSNKNLAKMYPGWGPML